MNLRNKIILYILLVINIGLMGYLFVFNQNSFVITNYDEIFYTNLLFTLVIVLTIIGGIVNLNKLKYYIPINLFAHMFYTFAGLNIVHLINNPNSYANSQILILILVFILTIGNFLILITNKSNSLVSKIALSVLNLSVVGLSVYLIISSSYAIVLPVYIYISIFLTRFHLLQLTIMYWMKGTKKEVVIEKEEIVIPEEIIVEEIIEEPIVVEEEEIEEKQEEEKIVEPKATKPKKKEVKPTFVYNEDKEKLQIMKRYEKMYKEGLVSKEELLKIRRENGFDKV